MKLRQPHQIKHPLKVVIPLDLLTTVVAPTPAMRVLLNTTQWTQIRTIDGAFNKHTKYSRNTRS
jgi:hypothetical protein